jgi:hypothetical protein
MEDNFDMNDWEIISESNDRDEHSDNFKDFFRAIGLCLLGWIGIFLLIYLIFMTAM